VVRRGKIKINAAEGLFAFGLAQDNGDLFIESDAMAKVGAAILVGFDGFFHQRSEGSFAFLGSFIEAYDVLLKSL